MAKNRKKMLKVYSGYAIFQSDVKAADKYKVTSQPKIYKTKEAAKKGLEALLKKGWTRSELKILKY